MPYPHKNSDGKATLGHDEKGNPVHPEVWDYFNKSMNHPAYQSKVLGSFAPIMEAEVAAIKAQMEKDKLAYKKLEEKLSPTPGELGKPEWVGGEFVNFHIHKGPPKPVDPVLIPATTKYTDLWKPKFHGEPPKPIPIQSMGMKIRLDGVLPHKTYGHALAINTQHDYTESEVRKMLEDSFRRITDMIIKEMKEKKNG